VPVASPVLAGLPYTAKKYFFLSHSKTIAEIIKKAHIAIREKGVGIF